jgi:hypothetical protein
MSIRYLPIALLLASAVTPPADAKRDHNVEVSRIAGWTLKVRLDRFTGRRTCLLSFWSRIDYERGALVFHLAPRIDTSAAAYRVNDGVVIEARDDLPDLARRGFLLEDDNLDNPSGGLVRIPEARLAGARSVRIEPGPNQRSFLFNIAGFPSARDRAHTAGCDGATFGDSKSLKQPHGS